MQNIKLSSNDYGNSCILEDGSVIEFPLSWFNILMETLKEWRSYNAKEINLPAYCVCPDKTLNSIINVLPRNKSFLWLVDGLNDVLIDTYGDDIVNMIDDFLKHHSVVDVLYSKNSFAIKNQRIKGILGFLGLLDDMRPNK